jgi:hypothetical protein
LLHRSKPFAQSSYLPRNSPITQLPVTTAQKTFLSLDWSAARGIINGRIPDITSVGRHAKA